MTEQAANDAGLTSTKGTLDTQDWKKKFADQFTDQVVSTDMSYTSPDLAIHITKRSAATNRIDHSSNGLHERYGANYAYVLADIYVSDITCLRTCFAQDIYGIGYTESLKDMSARLSSILAINGDSYSNSRHENNGTIIRNGIIYRDKPTDMETCVLNWDGAMKIYQPGEMDTQTLIDTGAYQSWIFGPSLLDEQGKARTSFLTWDYIRRYDHQKDIVPSLHHLRHNTAGDPSAGLVQSIDGFHGTRHFSLIYIVRERHHPGNDRDLQRMSRRSCTEYKSTAITVLLRSVIFKPALCALRRSRT